MILHWIVIVLVCPTQPECPMLSLGLPEAMYCTMDELCLGMQCCLDMKVAMFRMVYKIYARFDPCAFALVVGVDHPVNKFEKSFGPDFGLSDIVGGMTAGEAGVVVVTTNFVTVEQSKHIL